MEVTAQTYTNLLSNIFSILFFFKFYSYNTDSKIRKHSILIFTFVYLISSFFSSETLCTFYILIIDFLFVCIVYHKHFKNKICFFIKYECAYLLSFSTIFLLHSALMGDFTIVVDSSIYVYYKGVICGSMVYIIYVLYLNTRKILSFSKQNKHYQYYFNIIMLVTLLILSYSTLYICKNELNNNFVLPFFFSAIYILVAVFLSIYDKFITLFEENAMSKIQEEKSRLEQQYSIQIEDNLKLLHSIRHDIKNHLILIDGYALKDECDKIHDYIQRIVKDFSSIYLIETPSDTVSSLLNAKYQECLSKNIHFKFEYEFEKIHIDDYYIITILGNLLDNSITAASKLIGNSGYITLSIFQVSSYLEITMKNNHSEKIRTVGCNFISTKNEETSFHGIGIKNVRMAIEKLNGQFDIHYTDDTFSVSIMIPNY